MKHGRLIILQESKMVDLGGYVIILVETKDKRVKLYGELIQTFQGVYWLKQINFRHTLESTRSKWKKIYFFKMHLSSVRVKFCIIKKANLYILTRNFRDIERIYKMLTWQVFNVVSILLYLNLSNCKQK